MKAKTVIISIFLSASISLSAQETEPETKLVYSNITEIGLSTVTLQGITYEITSVENNKKSFFSKEEMSVEDYYHILGFIKCEYGEDSEQYKFLLPDTAKFRTLVKGGENTVLKFVNANDNEDPIGFRIKSTVVSKK